MLFKPINRHTKWKEIKLIKNGYGQLGKGDLESRRWPAPVDKLAGVPIVQIDCGDQFSMALTVSGNVYSWGNNKVD